MGENQYRGCKYWRWPKRTKRRSIKHLFQKAFETNFETAVNLTRTTQEELRKTRGNLLFISSIAGLEMIGAPTDYSIAKSALIMLSKQLSHKLAPEIRVNCIAPGNIFLQVGAGKN